MNNTPDDKISNPFVESAKQLFNTGAQSVSNIAQTASNVATQATNTVADRIDPAYSSYFNNNYLYIGLLLVIIICVIIAVVLYKLITTKLFLNIKNVANDTRVPVLCNEKNKYDFVYDKTGNGERRSYTFWIYIHNMNENTTSYKHVFSIRSDSKDSKVNNSSPCVFLDKTQNRMYVFFGEIIYDSASTSSRDATMRDLKFGAITDETILDKFMKYGITVPYIPLQRWVHVAIVCNANSYKNYVYAYVDGDLVNTTSTGEYDKYITINGKPSSNPKDFKNIDLNSSGILITGGVSNDSTDGCGFSGLVSKISTYNYELNQKDVFEDYYSGPIGGALAKIGLGMYGFRNPIYKL